MKLTRNQIIGAGLVGAAGLVAYAGLRRRSERVVKCGDISNRAGGSLTEPCPTEGPVTVCSSNDYASWRERLGIQLDAVTRLSRNLEDLGLLDISFYDAIGAYTRTAAGLVGQSAPLWTSETDIAPMLSALRVGCDVLNQGNAAIVRAGRPEYVIAEPSETKAFAETASPPSRLWMPLVILGSVAGAYYVGKKLVA